MKNPLLRAFILSPLILCSIAFILEYTVLQRYYNPTTAIERTALPTFRNPRILSKSRVVNDFPISPHFNLRDFVSPDTQEVKLMPYVVYCLEKLQKRIAPKHITINSGYRTLEHNKDKKVKGATKSHHLRGMAVDCYVQGLSLTKLAKLGLRYGFSTAIVYSNHVHFDVRKKGLGLKYAK